MNFDPDIHIQKVCDDLQKYQGETVLVAISGGVDSSTTAKLIERAGLKYELITIDTGFIRFNDLEFVKKIFRKVKIINAKNIFYNGLSGETDSAEKRKIFRDIYFDIIKNFAVSNKISCMVQGTQFPKPAVRNYHNLPTEKFLSSKIKVIEPVKGLTKDQVRMVARKLKLPEASVMRRPFPGPGLLIRFSGEYTKSKLSLIKKITLIVDDFVEKHKEILGDCYQVFPYLTSECVPYVDRKNKYAVGPVVLIRTIEAQKHKKDIIYKPFHLPANLEEKLVTEIMNFGTIGRVCFDQTSKYGFGANVKSGGTIEYA